MKKGISPQNTFLDTIATKFDGTHSNFVLGNAQGHGCPIVYCSDGFCELSGYPRSQVMGRSCACKFLFGEDTTSDEKEKIEEALEDKIELKTEVFLYKKDGSQFKCLLDIVPIKNEKSQVVLILVSHKDVGPKQKFEDVSDKSSSENENDSDEEMAEAYRRCQARRGRASGMPAGASGYNNQRRRSRAVLYHLSGQFEKQNRAKRAKNKLQQFNKFSSISGKMPEYKVQEIKKSKFILVHYGIFKINWDWLILLCTFYTAVLVPFNAAFTRSDKKNQRDSIYSDVVVEILFMFDILFNFRTSFVNKSGQVVYEAHLIAMNYMRGWFLLDLLAAIPFDFLYIFNINADAPVHLLKVARLLRLARLLQKIDRFSQYSALVLALLMSMFTLLAHWLACIWYAIGHVEFEDRDTSGWLFELSERLHLNDVLTNETTNATSAIRKPDVLMSYLSALYFTCSSLTSVGFGNVSANTNSEKIFSICAMIIGALMHAVVFGNVTALIQRMYQRRANFHSKTKDLKDFFRAYDIPKPLKQRMQEYFQTMWSMNNGIETNEILKDFPEEMKGELGLHLHKEVLNLPIFEEATQGCLKSIALHTRRSFCAPGEFLVHKGDASHYLFLLVSGSMEILKMDMVVAILGKGDLFGSDVDFDEPVSVCNFDVRSLTYSELQCINIKGLTDVLLLYPEFAEKFSKDIQNDLTYNLRHSCEDSDEEAESSPKPRICTLPSISEDDELSGSDEDEEDKDDKEIEEEDALPPITTTITSPLLTATRHLKIPNGDIDNLEPISSPQTTRAWAAKRGHAAVNRGSLKENRKLRLAHLNDPVEKLLPHVQNLQNDIEGTKTAITKLERKVGKIGQDISAIDRNMREILKHMTNISKMSPLDPLPPSSPMTPLPNSSSTMFQFDNVCPFRSEHFQHEEEDDHHDVVPVGKESTQKTPSTLFVASAKPPHQGRRRGGSVKIPRKHNYPAADGSKGSNLLDPYSTYQRRHSDGTHAALLESTEKNRSSENCDDPLRESVRKEYRIPRETQTDNRPSLAPLLIGHKHECEEDMDDTKGNGHSGFKNMLTDVHSSECSAVGRKRSKTIENMTRPNTSPFRKSETCGNIGFISSSDNGDKHSSDGSQVETNNSLLLTDRKSQEILPTYLLNDMKMMASIPMKSASAHALSEGSYTKPSDVAKSKSHDILETEFGANTPNEVRTFHVRARQNQPLNASNKAALDSRQSGPRSDQQCPVQNNVKISHGSPTDSSYSPDSCESSKLYNNIPDQTKTDSGHVSLVDCSLVKPTNGSNNIVDIDLEQTKIFLGDIAPKFHEGHTGMVNHGSLHLESEKSSPDSLSDISESLKTDSFTVDINSPILDTGQVGHQKPFAIDGHTLRTTDL